MSDKNFLRLCLFGVVFGFLGSTSLLFVSLFAYLIEGDR